MSIVSDMLERARTLIFHAREERELEEEIRFHIDMEAEQQRRAGMDAAEAGAIRGMVIRQGLALGAIGIAVGALGAMASSRLLASLLFHVSPLDPRVLGAVALLMVTVAMLAAYPPARHATSLDPRTVLQGK